MVCSCKLAAVATAIVVAVVLYRELDIILRVPCASVRFSIYLSLSRVPLLHSIRGKKRKETYVYFIGQLLPFDTFCPLRLASGDDDDDNPRHRSCSQKMRCICARAPALSANLYYISIRVNCLFIQWNSYVCCSVVGPACRCTADGNICIISRHSVHVLCFHKHKSIDSHCIAVAVAVAQSMYDDRPILESLFLHLTFDAFFRLCFTWRIQYKKPCSILFVIMSKSIRSIASIDSIPIYHSISYGFFFLFSVSRFFSFSPIELISIFAGEPQEECMRCGKMYILSSSDVSKGACGKCLGIPARDQIKSTPFRSSGESGTEEEEEEDEGEESSNGGTEFSDK